MRKVICLFTLILVIETSGFAQTNSSAPEYGTLSDVANMRRVYVYSDDLGSRDLILQERLKDPQLQVVGKLEEAEFFIFYGRSFFDTGYTSFGRIFGGVFGCDNQKHNKAGGVLRCHARRQIG